jgi:conjugative transposon TraK protein
MEEKKNVQSLMKVADSISESFAKLKFVTIACLVGAFLTACFCVWYATSSISGLGNKIYVLDKGQVLTASRQEVSITRADEVKAQSQRFHELFFTATPNREVVQQNLEAALKLAADRSVYNYYNDLQESGFYRRISQSNAVQEIAVDSVIVDTKRYPYPVVTFSSLYITRPTKIVKSRLVTRMNMIDVPRDETNLNGLKVENFEVMQNEEIESRNRR